MDKLFLGGYSHVELFPFHIFHKLRRHSFRVHPFGQRAVGPGAGLAAEDDEVDVAVFALPDKPLPGFGTQSRPVKSGAAQIGPVKVPKRAGVH